MDQEEMRRQVFGLAGFVVVGVGPRHRIIALAAQWVASANSVDGQIAALDAAMTVERLKRIGRAGGLEPAAMADPWGQKQPIGAHG